MNEAHFAEIEKVLLYVSEARERAARAAQALRHDGAELHLIEAVEETERQLKILGRALMQRTYFAVTKDSVAP